MSSQRLTYQELESLWVAAGGPKAIAPVMAAIAIAESGGNPHSLNDNPRTGDYSVGLWQINYFGSMYAGRSKEFGSPSALLASPTAQAQAAVRIYNQQGLRAWSTYSSGAYKRYLNGADNSGSYGGGGGGGGGGGSTATDASSSSSAAPDALWSINLPVIGQTTILTKGQGRAITGALLLASAVVVGGAGLIILSAYGLKKSGALDAAASAASVVPGAGGLAGKLATGARAVQGNAQPGPTRAQRKEASAREAQRARAEERAQAREARARANERRRAEKKGELPS